VGWVKAGAKKPRFSFADMVFLLLLRGGLRLAHHRFQFLTIKILLTDAKVSV